MHGTIQICRWRLKEKKEKRPSKGGGKKSEEFLELGDVPEGGVKMGGGKQQEANKLSGNHGGNEPEDNLWGENQGVKKRWGSYRKQVRMPKKNVTNGDKVGSLVRMKPGGTWSKIVALKERGKRCWSPS